MPKLVTTELIAANEGFHPVEKEVEDFAEATYFMMKELFETATEEFSKKVLRDWLCHTQNYSSPDDAASEEVKAEDRNVIYIFKYDPS